MKLKNKVLIIVIAIVVAAFAGTGFYLSSLSHNKAKTVAIVTDKLFGWKFPVTKFPLTGINGQLIAYSSIRDPGGIPRGLPVTLKIPVIGVDSAIEDALITPDGRMDVPAGSVNVAWFSLGPHPGQVGSAVIGGHFGIENGVPFVFYKLDQVKVGDKIYIVDDNNKTLAFVVRRIASFDRNADATTVFTSQDGLAHLNLITCEGVWNQVNGTYPQRLVVFTDAIPTEGAITVNTQAAAVTVPKVATNPSTNSGPTVEQKPTNLPTSSADSIPTAKETIPTSDSIKTSPISPQILIASAQSLYATPVDGIITSFLILAVAFMVFKIIRK